MDKRSVAPGRVRGDLAWILLALSVLAAACTTGVAGPTAGRAATGPPPLPLDGTPSTSPAADHQRRSPEPPIGEPPAASLQVEGGDPVHGALGSFSWQQAGTNAPWLSGSPIHVGNGETLTFSLDEPIALVTWSVSRQVPRSSLDGSDAVGVADGSGQPVRFGAPPPGSWTLQVSVVFTANLGSAAYYWLVEVDWHGAARSGRPAAPSIRDGAASPRRRWSGGRDGLRREDGDLGLLGQHHAHDLLERQEVDA